MLSPHTLSHLSLLGLHFGLKGFHPFRGVVPERQAVLPQPVLVLRDLGLELHHFAVLLLREALAQRLQHREIVHEFLLRARKPVRVELLLAESACEGSV